MNSDLQNVLNRCYDELRPLGSVILTPSLADLYSVEFTPKRFKGKKPLTIKISLKWNSNIGGPCYSVCNKDAQCGAITGTVVCVHGFFTENAQRWVSIISAEFR
jgi:hypothetical protein